MSKYGKWFPAALAACALAGLAIAETGEAAAPATGPQAEAAAEGKAARASVLSEIVVGTEGEGRPRVTLAGDGAFAFDTQTLENPKRLVVDLKGVTSRLSAPQVAVAEGGVVRVRAGQFRRQPDAVSRVVFDLEGDVAWTIREEAFGLVVEFAPAAAAVESAKAAPAAEPPAAEPVAASRALAPEAVDALLRQPALAAEPESSALRVPQGSFDTKTISSDAPVYSGKRISMNLVDTDIKQIFRLFHEISGLNFVLDPGVDGKVTIVLDNVPWDQALDIILKNNGLDKVLENNVIRIATTQKLASEAQARKALRENRELEVEPVTITRTLSYAKAKDVENVIKNGGILSARGKVIVDERTNALIVSDIPKRIEPLDVLIDTLDAETPQVMIEARIVETSKDFSQDVGVKWGFNAIADASRGTATRLNFPRNASVKYALNLPGEGGANAINFKFGNILDSFTLDLALNALETEGRGRILSSPKIATQNNEKAEIEQGVRIPVVNTTATEINVEFVSASLRLSVTPQITAEGTVIMDVTVENNQPDFLNRVGDVPPITTQRAQTKILVGDGGTAVIGGIFVVNEGVSDVGVPWFRKLPGVGWLFRNKVVTNTNRELLIFLTPKILKVG
ncbi:MAG TPA: type IV pilus secretin PilQ [Candidatus Polarisedimenticolaceae bacterium]